MEKFVRFLRGSEHSHSHGGVANKPEVQEGKDKNAKSDEVQSDIKTGRESYFDLFRNSFDFPLQKS